MSDKRATYVIGATFVAIAFVIGMVMAVPMQSATVNTTPLGMLGHAEIVLKDTDGNIKSYVQSDNTVVLNGQDCAADAIFGPFIAAVLCDGGDPSDFVNIHVGSDTANPTDASQTQLGVRFLSGQNRGVLIDLTEANSVTGALKSIRGTFTLIEPSTIAEVGLFDGGAVDDDMFSRIVLDTAISGDLDDTATITYIVEVGTGQP